MTLIAGLMCIDGILMCSDREESGENDKASVRKIFELGDSSYSLCIATAGHSALCDIAVKRIGEAAKAAGRKFASEHESIIEGVLREIYKVYIWPDEIPNQGDRDIGLIIGLYNHTSQEKSLYLTCDEILQPKPEYSCAGCGESIGNYFLERLFERSLTMGEAMELMGFIAREAKDSVGAVGRETEMVTIRNDGLCRSMFSRATDRHIPHLSQCVDNFWKAKTKP